MCSIQRMEAINVEKRDVVRLSMSQISISDHIKKKVTSVLTLRPTTMTLFYTAYSAIKDSKITNVNQFLKENQRRY